MWSIVVVFALFVLPFYFLRKIWKYDVFWRHLEAMPGPRRYPLVGALQIFAHNTPEKVFQIVREMNSDYPDVYCVILGLYSYVALSSPEDVELITSSMKHLEKSYLYDLLKPWLTTGLLTSFGEKWQTRRRVLTPAFHFSILQEFVAVFNKETEHLIKVLEKICQEDTVDVLKPIAEFTLSTIGETSFGVNFKEFPGCSEYKDALHAFLGHKNHQMMRPWVFSQFLFSLTPTGRANRRAIRTLHGFSTRVIGERQEKWTENASYTTRKRLAMLDLLLKAKMEEGSIDAEGIREEVDTFMFEGHDTVAMAICYVLVVLANQQQIQEEVLQEIIEVLGDDGRAPKHNDLVELHYTERCIKEVLRLFPSVPYIGRVASETFVTKHGYTVPKGTDLYVHVYDLHRNPRVWTDPEKFDPDRFLPDNVAGRHPFAYIPFSAGPRNCIGQRYALLEIKSVLCGILRRFRLEPVIKTEEIRFKSDPVLRPVGELRVRFVPREYK